MMMSHVFLYKNNAFRLRKWRLSNYFQTNTKRLITDKLTHKATAVRNSKKNIFDFCSSKYEYVHTLYDVIRVLQSNKLMTISYGVVNGHEKTNVTMTHLQIS